MKGIHRFLNHGCCLGYKVEYHTSSKNQKKGGGGDGLDSAKAGLIDSKEKRTCNCNNIILYTYQMQICTLLILS